MGEMVEFPSNGSTAEGYLAGPDGRGPGLVVVQEWWGLVPHIKDVADRFAAEGFVALAPDLFHGEATFEPDQAGKLLMDLDLERAGRDLGGSVDYLLGLEQVEPKKVGSVGFCAGGALALMLATLKPVDAAITFYGGPIKTKPNYANLRGPVLGHFGTEDHGASPGYANALFDEIRSHGVDATLYFYEGADHAFFNDDRPSVHHPEHSDLAWRRTLDFFGANLR
jgi:carboxymethylenebutenolidase